VKNFTDLLKSMGSLESMAKDMQSRIADVQVTGTSGAGTVSITLSGAGAIIAVRIDPDLVRPGDGEVIQDLIIAAHADAKAKLEEAMADQMRHLTGGLSGAFKMPF